MSDVTSPKAVLRREMRARRHGFVSDLEPEESDGAFATLPRALWPLFAPARTIGLYHAIGSEAPTLNLIRFVVDARRTAVLPWFADAASPMAFRVWRPGDPLEPGPLGMGQPTGAATEVEPDLLFVPLLAFDAKLSRLGQGRGHYDRWLAAHEGVPAIGLGWSAQEVEELPLEPHDVPLDAMLTERSVLTRREAVAL